MFDIITIGSATRDVYFRSKALMIMRSEAFKTGAAECIALGSKVEVSDIHFTVGGSAANTAVTFARQGYRTAVITRVGKDLRGEELERSLKKEKIDTRFMQKDARGMTAYSAVLLAPSGERSILVYRGVLESLSHAEVPWKNIRAKWLYITHLPGKSAVLFTKAIAFAAKHHIKVAVNPGVTQLQMPLQKLRPLLNKIDAFFLNREEASYLTHIPYQKHDAIFKRLDAWVKGIVVMTDGPRGVTVSDGTWRWHAGILKERKLVDRLGAGDAFGSGFLASYMRKKDIVRAIQTGSANATSVIEHIGAQPGIVRTHESIYRWGKLAVRRERAS